MNIYLLRHGLAGERDSTKYPDDAKRPLTAEGRKKMKRAAKGMRALDCLFDLILSSPFERTRETAEIVAAEFHPPPPVRLTPHLASGSDPHQMLGAIPKDSKPQSVLLVGHEPDLSGLVSALLGGSSLRLPIAFRKGGLCRLDTVGSPRLGQASLVAFYPPKILRRLADL